ncbi:SUMF1/EgtB/PvdO family nonheme iron enzyme [bacterium]|nr:SUMF1/EgtB/PvdO family nonheme iron enzyme [bacterium]
MVLRPDKPNAVEFPVQEARFVRFVILATTGSEGCIDELEVYGPDSESNLALAKTGAKASASSCLPGYTIHQIPHLNDGRYGNDYSWIAAVRTGEWAQIELPKSARINRVIFSRDRKGRHQGRLPTAFEVQVSGDGRQWSTVRKFVNVHVLVPERKVVLPHRPIVLDLPALEARFVRLVIRKTNNGVPPCVDELEVYGADRKTNLALASRGGKASASSCIEGHAIHQVEHLNDGKYTNTHSWIPAKVASWAQIELPKATTVCRVVFSRDRGGSYADRLASEFEIHVSLDGKDWAPVKKVVGLTDVPFHKPVAGETPQEWAQRVAMALPAELRATAEALVAKVKTEGDVQALLALHRLRRRQQGMVKRLALEFNPAAMRRAVADLTATFPDRYRPPGDFDAKLAAYERRVPELVRALGSGNLAEAKQAMADCEELFAFQRAALLANPLVDFGEVLVLKRKTPDTTRRDTYWQWGQQYGMTVNWSCDFRPKNPPVAPWWRDEIAALSLRGKEPSLRAVFKAKDRHMIQHPELHFDAKRLLFAMPGPQGAFQVFEVKTDGTGLRQITTDTGQDVDNGDPCYLPDGRIIFNSTRGFQAVPCEDGQSYVANLCITTADGSDTRMLTFDQESNWYPTLLNDGRVLYTRYEYANVSHQFGRLLFHMNPDGTGQAEYYGSNSYWPNSIFYARPVPNDSSIVIGVVCGHHGPNRTGPLVLFDPARARHEAAGAVQMIPGYGKKVERVVADVLYGGSWPKFVHPWPLSDKYFLASARTHPEQVEYAIYLVDVFDNITEICRLPDHSLFEPIPLKPRTPPPAIPDRVRPREKHSIVFMADAHRGQGLSGVPRGSVRKLRVFTYNYMYRDTVRRGFGHLATVGVDGPWEPRHILGTVPVRPNGSALFKVPANVPISVQPLDAEGRALQVMRSWFTAMPGEVLSCVGCHEPQGEAPPVDLSNAPLGAPDRIKPWRGPPRGFDFEREVQPVLDRFCVGCHDGSKPGRPVLSRKTEEEKLAINKAYHAATESHITTILTPSFIALHPYVRRPHAESHYGAQVAAEYFADTSPLVQMLKKGHHGVRLDDEAWDRLYTWIDLSAPDHGSWKNSEWGAPANYYERRLEMLRRFANRTDDVEWLPPPPEQIPGFVHPPKDTERHERPSCPGWPFDAAVARRRQKEAGLPETLTLKVADGLPMGFVLIPPGEFVMGDPAGPPDERLSARVAIRRPFYLGRCEVTNAQFAALGEPAHRSGVVGWRSIDWRGEGHPLSAPDQPAVRVSWRQAMAFCEALSAKTRKRVALPTEAQWEWACRAGSMAPLWYGGLDDDFSSFENLAGREQRRFAFSGKRKWYLRDDRFDDGAMVTAAVGSFRANPWGLHDMAGNACEWTRTAYRPYPYDPGDGRDQPSPGGEKVVRGGSWFDKPNRARSAFRWKYPAWRKVHNVGFRVIVVLD